MQLAKLSKVVTLVTKWTYLCDAHHSSRIRVNLSSNLWSLSHTDAVLNCKLVTQMPKRHKFKKVTH